MAIILIIDLFFNSFEQCDTTTLQVMNHYLRYWLSSRPDLGKNTMRSGREPQAGSDKVRIPSCPPCPKWTIFLWGSKKVTVKYGKKKQGVRAEELRRASWWRSPRRRWSTMSTTWQWPFSYCSTPDWVILYGIIQMIRFCQSWKAEIRLDQNLMSMSTYGKLCS